MWLFTKHGFFSAVQNWDDANLIHVRARFKGDLEKLCEAHTQHTDYPYRMDFDREKLAEIVKGELMAIDYTNFKDAVHDGTSRDSAYMNVWMTMGKYQN